MQAVSLLNFSRYNFRYSGINVCYIYISVSGIKYFLTDVSRAGADMKKVLLVDDSYTMRQTIAGILSVHGWAVIEAANGEQAMIRINLMSEHPDLIVLDREMPVMDGMVFMTWLRATANFTKVKVLMMSDQFSIADLVSERNEAILAGADACILKPFRLETFQQKMEKMGFIPAESSTEDMLVGDDFAAEIPLQQTS